MSLSAYLAKNYLTASGPQSSDPSDTRPSKKRKKNKDVSTEALGSLVIADDDDDLRVSSKNKSTNEDDEHDKPTLFTTQVRSAEFRKSKKNAWQTLSDQKESDLRSQQARGDSNTDADEILRQTIADRDRTRADLDDENAPAIVEDTTPRMESGVRAGLQTAADTARLQAEEQAQQEAEAAHSKQAKKSKRFRTNPSDPSAAVEETAEEEQTIYRDATGRRIDLSLRRAEARKAEADKRAAEKKAREDAMGEVQLRRKEERKQELEDAKFLTLGRTVDDDEYNDRLKGQVRWDDPMAAYMAEKRTEQDVDSSNNNTTSSGKTKHAGKGTPKRRKEYQGAAPPNRYGIKPGWRWDGVDRGNGFEKEWFQARGRRARNENLEYQWQMDE